MSCGKQIRTKNISYYHTSGSLFLGKLKPTVVYKYRNKRIHVIILGIILV